MSTTDRRLKLDELLKKVPGIKKTYFQPPANVSMTYPCIRYYRVRPDTDKADDMTYRFTQCYELIVIEYDPDSEIARYIVEHFQMATINTVYVTNNLYHTSITLYY